MNDLTTSSDFLNESNDAGGAANVGGGDNGHDRLVTTEVKPALQRPEPEERGSSWQSETSAETAKILETPAIATHDLEQTSSNRYTGTDVQAR